MSMSTDWFAEYDDAAFNAAFVDENFDYLLRDQIPFDGPQSSEQISPGLLQDGNTPNELISSKSPLFFSNDSLSASESVKVKAQTSSPLHNPHCDTYVESWSFDSSILESSLTGEDKLKSSKCNRAEDSADSYSACWKSTFCLETNGNHPETCNDECAPAAFAGSPLQNTIAKEPVGYIETGSRVDPKTFKKLSHNLKRTGTNLLPYSGKRSFQKDGSDEHMVQKSSPGEVRSHASQTAKSSSRTPHHQVERKYRKNVNTQLEALMNVLPASKLHHHETGGLDIEDNTSSARKPAKATVVSSATAYIKQLERENKELFDEVQVLKERTNHLHPLKRDDFSPMKYGMQQMMQDTI